ncbi:HupE/UreJ family protein [Actinoplanes sp. NPDC051343]|uniref:HupE/UreJ family protein n=1 Tax=Actinoplanes sp. NPDC051343 TaxID=3363906 RepID=UPI0037888A52
MLFLVMLLHTPLPGRRRRWLRLMHGLAFAALLGGLDLGRGPLVVSLLGFDLGIELTQLILVALLMPSLLLLSRIRLHPRRVSRSPGSASS